MPIPTLLRPYLLNDLPDRPDRSDIVKALKPRYSDLRVKYGSAKIPVAAEDISIQLLDISVRTYHCLADKGVETIGDIGHLTFNDLINAPNFGITSLVDLLMALESIAIPEVLERAMAASTHKTAAFSEFLTQSDVAELELPSVNRIPFGLRGKKLPSLPPGLDLNALHLSNRLVKRLASLGIITNPENLSDYTLNDLAQIEGLGTQTIVEFVSRLKPYCPGEAGESSPEELSQVQETCKALEAIPGLRVTSRDCRLGLLLQRAAPGFLSIEEFLSAVREEEIRSVAESQISALDEFVEAIFSAKRLTLNDEISSVLETVVNERNVEIISARYGYSGGEESTLEETGQRFGLTRQRVEQICSRAESRLKADSYLPVLDAILCAIKGLLPNTAVAIENELEQQGLTRKGTQVGSIVSFARMVGREPCFDVTSIGDGRLVDKISGSERSSQVLRFVRRTIKQWGGARLSGVLEHFAGDSELNPAIIKEIIHSEAALSWLDTEHEWFWFSDNRSNRVLNRMEKIWSVTSKIRLIDLREAVRRHHRMQGSAPPQAILAELCRQNPDLIVEGDTVMRKEGIPLPDSLSQIERTMVDILRNLGSIANRESFETACAEAGIGRETFYMYIDNSSVFKKFARGVYGVVGWEATLSEIENLRPSYHRGRILQDFGWISGNEVWIAYRLSESCVKTGLLSIPEPLKNFITDSFILEGRATTVWRQGPLSLGDYLESTGCQAGDFVAFTFDLKNRLLRAELDSSKVQSSYLD